MKNRSGSERQGNDLHERKGRLAILASPAKGNGANLDPECVKLMLGQGLYHGVLLEGEKPGNGRGGYCHIICRNVSVAGIFLEVINGIQCAIKDMGINTMYGKFPLLLMEKDINEAIRMVQAAGVVEHLQ
jgi:hypothetical protein